MKQALKEIEEIKRMKLAMNKSSSKYLKKDYGRAIKRKIIELADYCKYHNIDIKELMRCEDLHL